MRVILSCERCGGFVSQQVGVAVKLLIVQTEGSSFLLIVMSELEWNFGMGFETVTKRCKMQGQYNSFGSCVTEERESVLYRVDKTVQGELVFNSRVL